MERFRIYYRYKGDGIVFISSPTDMDKLVEAFPETQPAKSVYIRYGMTKPFKTYKIPYQNLVLTTLIGHAEVENIIKGIKRIEFMLMPDEKVTHTIEQSQHDSEVQLIRG
jgi:hypothetical protein